MDEVLAAVVDVVELEIEIERVLEEVLKHADSAEGPLARLRGAGPLGPDHLVQHRVIAGEGPVQRLVIGLLADVNGGYEVDGDVSAVLVGGDGALEFPSAMAVVHEAEEGGL